MLYGTALAALLALPGAQAQLNKLAKGAGLKYFGSATDNGELTDTAYVAILDNTDEFGQIVSVLLLVFFFGLLSLGIGYSVIRQEGISNCSDSTYARFRSSFNSLDTVTK